MLLDVANFMALEACLDRGSCYGSGDGGIGVGLADSSNIGKDLGAAVRNLLLKPMT